MPAATSPEASNEDGGLSRPYLRPCLLLLLAEGPSHGYELLEQVRRLGIRAAEPGGLYRSLRQMERGGLVRSWWEPSAAGPARRTYVLTGEGRRALDEAAQSLAAIRGILVGLLDRYECLDSDTDDPRPDGYLMETDSDATTRRMSESLLVSPGHRR
ncbi:MAG: PadR family transcriptional regulator [Acidimicrobiales bacterium]